MEDIGGWLLAAAIAAVQLTIGYAMVRLFIVGGGFNINPFKKGWTSLRAAYGIATPPTRMESTSALIGSVTYKNLLSIRLDPEGLYLGKSFLGTSYVYIPYRAVAIVQAPRRVTVLRIPILLDGLFRVGEVDISLQAPQAKALIECLVYWEKQVDIPT